MSRTFACVGMSEGGTSTESVTVKRDATPPSLTCVPTPSELWPPNGKLTPVGVGVELTDTLSGASGFLLTDAPASDAVDFDVQTADIAGLLRAERVGNGADRTYLLIYTGREAAGNTPECAPWSLCRTTAASGRQAVGGGEARRFPQPRPVGSDTEITSRLGERSGMSVARVVLG